MVKSWWQRLDYVLIFLMIILVIFGLIMIYSANSSDAFGKSEFSRQLLYFFIGIVFLVVFAAIDYQFLASIELYMYIVTCLTLMAVLAFGRETFGAQRWVNIGSFSFQPSEIAKIFIIISMASRLSDENALKFEKLAVTLIYIAIPIALIMKQPDLGTALVLITIFFIMLFIRGFNPLLILLFAAIGLAVSPFLLKDYQRRRLLVFLNPNMDPTGDGWNLQQSMTGIGSGKLWGKGLFISIQTQLTHLEFVPEHSRDFIFTVLGEQLGFVGGASLIALYFFFLWKILRIAHQAKDSIGTLIAAGIAGFFFFHIFVNVGMTIGIMPITGIPLPFLSYGGSSLITNMIAVGLLLNISMRQEQFFK